MGQRYGGKVLGRQPSPGFRSPGAPPWLPLTRQPSEQPGALPAQVPSALAVSGVEKSLPHPRESSPRCCTGILCLDWEWPSFWPSSAFRGLSFVGVGLFWRTKEYKDLPDPPLPRGGGCPHQKQNLQSQPLHHLAGPPEGQVAGERATLRPRVKGKHPTEDEELSGARPGGRVLRSCLP